MQWGSVYWNSARTHDNDMSNTRSSIRSFTAVVVPMYANIVSRVSVNVFKTHSQPAFVIAIESPVLYAPNLSFSNRLQPCWWFGSYVCGSRVLPLSYLDATTGDSKLDMAKVGGGAGIGRRGWWSVKGGISWKQWLWRSLR